MNTYVEKQELEPEAVYDGLLADREKTSFGAYQLASSEPSAAGDSRDPSERDVVADDGLARIVRRPNLMPKNFPPVHKFQESSD